MNVVPHEFKKAFAARLSAAIDASGHSKAEFARLTQLPDFPALSKFLRGASTPNLLTLRRMLPVLNVDAAWLICGDEVARMVNRPTVRKGSR